MSDRRMTLVQETLPAIAFENVCKQFGSYVAIPEFSATVAKGATIVLCGPSGSGKSTLSRTVNGLEVISKGRILVDGADVGAKDTDIDLLRRNVGFVFQQYNLFPHLSVIENVALGLRRLLGWPRDKAYDRSMQLLKRVGLDGKADRRPSGLSGGEQQRVAIARALSMSPSIIIFDEPTSALDPIMAAEVQSLIGSLATENMTILCVTHDLAFAKKIADQIWFMEKGLLVEASAPSDFFNSSNARVRQFLSNVRH